MKLTYLYKMPKSVFYLKEGFVDEISTSVIIIKISIVSPI